MLMANEFIESVVDGSARLAKHRNATAIEPTDINLHLGISLTLLMRMTLFRETVGDEDSRFWPRVRSPAASSSAEIETEHICAYSK